MDAIIFLIKFCQMSYAIEYKKSLILKINTDM